MSFYRVVALGLAGAVVCSPLAAQGIPRRAAIKAGPTKAATRMLVANPYATASTDSALAVALGAGIRNRMEKVAGSDYYVIPDSTMNRALREFGYPQNAILSPALARLLAQNIQGRVLLTSTLARGTVAARFLGTNDPAGVTVTMQMPPNTNPADFGGRVADAFGPAVKAYPDVRACMDQQKQNPAKATEAANKALKEVPNHGLAAYCLAQIAQAQNQPAEAMKYLQMAVKGDSLSLQAWGELAAQDLAAKDTAKVLDAYTQMLRIAPGEQKLRQDIFRFFLQANRPELAKNIADEGIKLDPYNADFYDLKSNACLFLSDFRCAVGALEQLYTVDSTRADTLFFTKLGVAAEQRLADTMPPATAADTQNFVKWAKVGATKFPNNLTLLQSLNRAYAYSGQVDSSLAVTQKLMQLDSTATAPAVAAIQALAGAKRLDQATPYIQFVQQHGDAEAKEKAAVVLVNAASGFLQPPASDYQRAADAAKQAVAMADPQGRVAPPANFIMGLASFQVAANSDAEITKSKSCDGARREKSLLDDAAKGFTAGRAYRPDAVAKYDAPLAQFQKHADALVKAFCK